ncbi:hypothetical protein [Arthrobacter dokdonensis]|uniref:hypothetical protein n=1 Tax=Arthrobacter dokdonellae TaxID=2211210 RepID=UPI000DE5BABA|nr:hypothetical protein [Arthrobacter dokdonellae]
MTQQKASTTAVASERKGPAPSTAVLGPLTVRDIAALVGVLVIFVASLLPLVMGPGFAGNLWNLSPLFFLGIGVILPLAVGVLFVIRRLSPEVKPRVGSLSVDQFASVVAGFATFYFFLATVTGFRAAYLVALIGALVLLAATVLAQWIPFFASDFSGRAETPAHPAARDAVVATRRPGAHKPVLALSVGSAAGGAAGVRPGQFQKAPSGQGAGQDRPVPGPGWNAGSQTPAHTPAGQIFTPAGAAGTAGVTGAAGSAEAAAAAQPRAAVQGDGSQGDAARGPVGHGAAAQDTPAQDAAPQDTAKHGTPAQDSTAQDAAPATTGMPASRSAETVASQVDAAGTGPRGAGASAQVSANVGEAQAGHGAEPAAGVVPSAERAAESAPATTLNPKVVESAPSESIGATVNPQAQPVVADPFWFAVDRPQNVVDEHTRQFVFKLMPGSWILALEDRGSSFLVQDSHGKTGLLLDLVGVERAPEGQ